MRLIPPQAVDLIKQFEGFKADAYQDVGGVWTIGFGTTRNVHKGMSVDRDKATQMMLEDVGDAASCVEKLVRVTINDNQFSALIDFVYNVGAGKFSNSTLLKLLNKGWYEQVPMQLSRWCLVNGEEVGGLKRRRSAEIDLWNKRGN